MDFLFGALGAVLALGLFNAGVFVGWRLHGRFCRPKADSPDEDSIRQMKAEQDAFRQLTHYSAEVAYGIQPAGNDSFAGGEVI